MRGAPVVDVKGLWTVYGDLVVHRDLDFSVMPGEVMSLVGGSGSGKTTLLRPLQPQHLPQQRSERSEEHTSELQSQSNLVCRLLLEKKKMSFKRINAHRTTITSLA